ncbi:MAG: bifunctional folylpolyglutamate synthase/dihydrofolate synthase [Planctomycetes bacterium]|nr:bifunctional folylpolyglutamate synthase/dihydrofolate synthase [Planctomycetota bacterium]MBL7142951.1 bifunctional folylpolyglutamate synthase/dihydrofolate synthase [Phycisphaerae bacterium]
MAKTKKTTGKKRKNKTSKVASVKSKKAFKTYKQALDYLFERTDYEKQERLRYNVTTFNLNRMQKLLSLLGSPHKKIHTVHIGGTKGKGSTATMLARMLEANGYKVGLYTSPHVVHLHERIAINSRMISESEMCGLLNRAYAPVEKMSKTDQPTFFEIMTALAFMYFRDEEVDIAIIETGLGGRLDSTNVIIPKVIGITSLSIDHQNLLGNTIDSIAKEKAGIFKRGVPAVTVQQEPSAMRVLRSQAIAVQSPLSVTGSDIDFSQRFETSREHGPHTRICLSTPTSKFEHLRVPLHGRHQAINCGLALAMLDKLKSVGYKIDNGKAAEGLYKVSLTGRMEMIWDDPRIMIDAAHNAASIKALIHAVGQNIPYDSMVVIFGCNSDKDIRGMLHQLQFGADKVIFTRSNSPKAVSPEDLAEMYTEICGKMCQTAPSLGQALLLAKSAVSKEDLICITGSFYLIGQAKIRFQPDESLQTV